MGRQQRQQDGLVRDEGMSETEELKAKIAELEKEKAQLLDRIEALSIDLHYYRGRL